MGILSIISVISWEYDEKGDKIEVAKHTSYTELALRKDVTMEGYIRKTVSENEEELHKRRGLNWILG